MAAKTNQYVGSGRGRLDRKKKAVVCYHSRALSLVFIKHVDLKGLVFSKSTYFELLASCVI